MKHKLTRLCALLLALLIGLGAPAMAADDRLDGAVTAAARYLLETVQTPKVGSSGGEWAVLGLARSGEEIPEDYFQAYYAGVEEYVAARKGKLHDRKYTEYSRLILALSAIGKDARMVAGYDLTLPLGDYDQTVWQGVNGPVWALLALDSAGYPMPENPQAQAQATRQMYVEHILACRLSDGGWSLTGEGASEADVTAMALQALAKYRDQASVARAVEEALAAMSKLQEADGGFGSWGTGTSESSVQMLVALTELGIPLDDPRFVKEGHTVLDKVLAYHQKGKGFQHTETDKTANLMASEQGLYGLVAAQRAGQGKNTLYTMTDAIALADRVPAGPAKGEGLPGRHEDVRPVAVEVPGATFPDVGDIPQRSAIETLAERGILNGKQGGRFDPHADMTRAEFATVVVKALGLGQKPGSSFNDVPADAWYAPYVGSAFSYGVVTGAGDGGFRPLGTITRQEAAVMVARAAKLCGLDTAMDDQSAQDILAQFPDYRTSADWARPALAFCFSQDILDQSELNIRPKVSITRAEIAQMLAVLLERSNLL